jgi:isocitrate dehydrogenase
MHRGKLDDNQDLISFCKTLEEVCIETVEDGKMTKDLALLVFRDDLVESNFLTTQQFLDELKNNLNKKLSS